MSLYSFELVDFDLKTESDKIAWIKCVDRHHVTIEYMDGRRVKYLYNPLVSEEHKPKVRVSSAMRKYVHMKQEEF